MRRMIDDDEELKDYGLIERKLLIHTDEYSISEDGMVDSKVPLTNVCYDLALKLKRSKEELMQYKKSKQASYESMQREWNDAVNKSRELKKENEELNKKYDDMQGIYQDEHCDNLKYKQALKEMQDILFSLCNSKFCTSICTNCEYGRIKLKISEALDESEK